MKVGKVPENVLKRSVFKQLHTTRKEVLLGAGVGEDCAAMKLAEDEVFVISTDPITGAAKDIGALAVQITVNDLASAGSGTNRNYVNCPASRERRRKRFKDSDGAGRRSL